MATGGLVSNQIEYEFGFEYYHASTMWKCVNFALTLSTVRLYAQTTNPCESIFKIKFWPITANPISAISAFLLEK